jgi:hemolysin III
VRVWSTDPERDQSKAEEIANSISHGVGLGLALAGTPFLILYAARHESVEFLVAASVFCATGIFLYLASTIYHALPMGSTKQIFRTIEQSGIFLLIAGTYTPFTLGVLHGTLGWTLFGVIWSLAATGVMLKIIYKASHPNLFTALYLLMGWFIVIAIIPLLERMPSAGFIWLLAGGLSYTFGVVFFVLDSRLKYAHLVWHLFVIAGTVCHYFAILKYAA